MINTEDSYLVNYYYDALRKDNYVQARNRKINVKYKQNFSITNF